MKRLLLIRHGATAGNLERRYIGRTDEPLCPKGMEQIQQLKQRLPAVNRLIVSPMLRTRQTAQILFPGMPMELAADFRETDFGVFEGKTYQELSGSQQYQAWLDTQCLGPVPEGEGTSEFRQRCRDAFAEIAPGLPDGTALVIHGGTIMAILEAFAQPKGSFYDYHIANGEAFSCVWEDGRLFQLEKV